jgi:hypothetical protein
MLVLKTLGHGFGLFGPIFSVAGWVNRDFADQATSRTAAI